MSVNDRMILPAAATTAARDRVAAPQPAGDAEAFREALARADVAAQAPRPQRRDARTTQRDDASAQVGKADSSTQSIEPRASDTRGSDSRGSDSRSTDSRSAAGARDRRVRDDRSVRRGEEDSRGPDNAAPSHEGAHASGQASSDDADGSAARADGKKTDAKGKGDDKEHADASADDESGDSVTLAQVGAATPGTLTAATAAAATAAVHAACAKPGTGQGGTTTADDDADATAGGAALAHGEGNSSNALAANGLAGTASGKGAGLAGGVSGGASGSAGDALTGGKNRAASANSAENTSALSALASASSLSPEDFSAQLLNASGANAPGPNHAPGPEADAASAQAGAGANAPGAGDLDANVARVARGLQTAVQQNGGAVTLRLDPPEMGVVRVLMEVRDGVTSVQFRTEKESAGVLLNQHMDSLRESLQRQGLSVERIDVQLMPKSQPADAPGQQWGQTPDDGRSRGQFTGGQDSQRGRDKERAGQGSTEPQRSFEQALVNLVG
ncbi:MAG: flagellar hook-length control protein FliK [Planctomycetota bacterium]|nr:flagellar hook-length control protein FliK [Planctomycetota bacterium]